MDAAIAPVPGNVCRTCHTEAPWICSRGGRISGQVVSGESPSELRDRRSARRGGCRSAVL